MEDGRIHIHFQPTCTHHLKTCVSNSQASTAQTQKAKKKSKKSVPTLGQSSQMSQGQTTVPLGKTSTHSTAKTKGSTQKKSPSKIEQLVQREEMNDTQTQTQQEQEEPTQVFGDEEDDMDANANAILEYESDESDHDLEESFQVHANGPTEPRTSAASQIATASQMESKSVLSCTSDSKAMTQDPNVPCARWGHTMNLIDGNKILVYGGQAYDEKENKNKTMKDLHVYDMEKRTWSKPLNCEGMPRCWVSFDA
jgi:hypothetical protein